MGAVIFSLTSPRFHRGFVDGESPRTALFPHLKVMEHKTEERMRHRFKVVATPGTRRSG